jgi:hypothetical protein
MFRLRESERAIVELLWTGERHHFELSPTDRRLLNKLWLRGIVRFRVGDYWQVTAYGLALLLDQNQEGIRLH